MAKKLMLWVRSNRDLIVLTFEVFWILVFLLDRVTRGNAVDIPQFIYVNF
jgi:hypothetical protein